MILYLYFLLLQDEENVDFNGQMFAVTSGDCLVDEEGCVSSPGFASGSTYNNLESCVIAVNTAVAKPLRVESFSTEDGPGREALAAVAEDIENRECLDI